MGENGVSWSPSSAPSSSESSLTLMWATLFLQREGGREEVEMKREKEIRTFVGETLRKSPSTQVYIANVFSSSRKFSPAKVSCYVGTPKRVLTRRWQVLVYGFSVWHWVQAA